MRDHCIRCGECCLASSPTLQKADVDLIRDGFIEKKYLYTIRAGELIRDNILQELKITDKEVVKVKERRQGTGCIYYDEKRNGCRIYDHRPVQCAALACWNLNEFMEIYNRPKAVRQDIIRDGVLLALMEKHDRKCSYSKLEQVVSQIKEEGEGAVREILELLKFDYHLRPLVSEKMGVDPRETDFFFGRPLIDTIPMFGLQVLRQPDGAFFLTTLDQ